MSISILTKSLKTSIGLGNFISMIAASIKINLGVILKESDTKIQ